jgi:sulfur carrier protein
MTATHSPHPNLSGESRNQNDAFTAALKRYATQIRRPTETPMNLTINGETQTSSAETVAALVAQLDMKPDRVAIELNREIVPREQWPQTALHDGDRLEIVHFVGGGSR